MISTKHRSLAGIAAVACIALSIASCGGKKDSGDAAENTAAPVQVAKAERGSIRRIVTAGAILYPLNQANVMPKISAPVSEFHVSRGDHVRKGELVAVLENGDLRAAARESKGAYEQTLASAHATAGAAIPEELNKSKQDLQAAQEAADAARKVYESRQDLYKQGALARKLVDDAAVAYAQARSQYDIARKHLAALQSVGQQAQLKGLEAQVDASKAHYQGSQAQLGYSEIRSPISGVVTDRPIYQGEMANAGSPLMTIMDVSSVIARANVAVDQAAHVNVGDPATITTPAGEAQGKVTVVSPAVDPNTTTVEIWVQAVNPGEKMKPGVSATVSILAETIPGAVLIPVAAILPSPEGDKVAMVVDSSSVVHEHKLELGVQDSGKVQVLSGVNPGDEVVTVGGVGLEDKAKVQVRSEKAAAND